MDLTIVLDTIRKEGISRRKALRFNKELKFSGDPLTEEECKEATWVEVPLGSKCTTYQHRALAVLDDVFYAYRWRKYQGVLDIFTIEEFKPMFCQIHRAVVFLQSQGLSVKEALYRYIRPNEARKESHDDVE